MSMKATTREFKFPSKSNPDRKPYVVKVYSDGTLSCDCKGWIMKKVGKPRECAHTKKVMKMLNLDTVKHEVPVMETKEIIKLPVMRPNDGTLEHMENLDTIVQLKYDGTYAFLIKDGDNVSMPGRSFKSDYVDNHPEFVRDAMKIPRDITLCGELVFVDKRGQDHFLTALAKQETWLELGYTPKYIVFDILKFGILNLVDLNWTWSQRNDLLQALFLDVEFENFELIENYVTLEEKKHAWKISNEGIVIKDVNSVVSDGRSNKWQKVKKLKTEDFWGIGFTEGTGARKTTFGAMIIANKTENGYEYVAKTSGFTNAQLKYFKEKMVENPWMDLLVTGEIPSNLMYFTDPVLVEIKYQRKTATGSLIMPRFVKERTDIQ